MEADYDTDDETVAKEQKKCYNYLREAVSKFVRLEPTELIGNLANESTLACTDQNVTPLETPQYKDFCLGHSESLVLE